MVSALLTWVLWVGITKLGPVAALTTPGSWVGNLAAAGKNTLLLQVLMAWALLIWVRCLEDILVLSMPLTTRVRWLEVLIPPVVGMVGHSLHTLLAQALVAGA